MVSGIILTYTRSFKIGDRVRIGESEGDVIEKTFFVTRIRTKENVHITVPNSTVLSSQVINYSTGALEGGIIVTVRTSFAYDVPWEEIYSLMIAAAGQTPNILHDPSPSVWQVSLDDPGVAYELRAWTNQPKLMAATSSALRENIQNQFKTAGLDQRMPSYHAIWKDGTATIEAVQLAAVSRIPRKG